MLFRDFAVYIQKIEQTASRLEITRLLSELFKKLDPEELKMAVYLLQGKITPSYQTVNFGMAEKMVLRAAVQALSLDPNVFTREARQIGDLGEAVQIAKDASPQLIQNALTLRQVFQKLVDIAEASGQGSQDVKQSLLSTLIFDVDALSARYIVRIPIGALRLGFSDMTILDAFSWMISGDKSHRKALEGAYHVRPDLGYLGEIIKKGGVAQAQKIVPVLFTPIIMMKAERMSSGEEIIGEIGECAVEPKFDGFRLQVHKVGDKVALFTRGLENATHMYPDIVEGVRQDVKVREAILEGEAIGYDPQGKNFLPFQETVQRKRKYGISEKAKEIPLKLFVFELLYVDGTNYIHEPYRTRRSVLESIISNSGKNDENTIIPASVEKVKDPARLEMMFDDALSRGLEGIVAKRLEGPYQPGARGNNWVKLKRSYSSKIDDTIDCVVMGYDSGKGKRAAFGIGAFLVGVYDPKAEKFVTVAKIGTGLSDDEWRSLKSKADKLLTKDKPNVYDSDRIMDPDIWIRPQIVVEIKADEITRSTIHTAGRIMIPTKTGGAMEVKVAGYALRFPRLVRFRDDKREADITTLSEIEKLFLMQSK